MKQFLDIVLDDNPSVWKQLCDLIREIDSDAADWMEGNPPDDPNNPKHASLVSSFTWAHTPQGEVYWYNLHHRIERYCHNHYPIPPV